MQKYLKPVQDAFDAHKKKIEKERMERQMKTFEVGHKLYTNTIQTHGMLFSKQTQPVSSASEATNKVQSLPNQESTTSKLEESAKPKQDGKLESKSKAEAFSKTSDKSKSQDKKKQSTDTKKSSDKTKEWEGAKSIYKKATSSSKKKK